jgi:hypothetical protein
VSAAGVVVEEDGGDEAIQVRWRPLVARAVIASAIDLAAVALLVAAGQLTALVLTLALVLHLAASASLALARGLPATRRSLLVAFALTLPVVGAPIALLSLAGGGARSEVADLLKDEPEPEPPPEVALIRNVADGLPAPDALLVADVEERRARLWALGRRADAESIALLRWALTAGPNDLGLEAALALEDLSIEFEKRLKELRRQLEETPTAACARAAGDHITHAFEVGAVDVAQLRAYADGSRSAARGWSWPSCGRIWRWRPSTARSPRRRRRSAPSCTSCARRQRSVRTTCRGRARRCCRRGVRSGRGARSRAGAAAAGC